MRIRPLIVAAAALACSACEPAAVREAEQAESELKLLKANHGSADELCDAHRRVADAWLKALDQDHYKLAKLSADTACLNARLQHELSSS